MCELLTYTTCTMDTPQNKPEPRKPKRRYRKITPTTIARLQAEIAIQGNATAAIRSLEPDSQSPAVRGNSILNKPVATSGAAYIEQYFQQIASDAVELVGSAIRSVDEKIALKAAMFTIDHVRGQAVKRSESRSIKVSIETVLK